MSATLTLNEDVVQRLHRLSVRAGQPAEAVLDRALSDYESKLLGGDSPPVEPRTCSEAELLDDPGRIRIAPRRVQAVTARIVSVGRQAPRVYREED